MSFSAIGAGGASEKVPHTEFWFLKTVKNDGFHEVKKKVLQNSGPMKFMAFVGEMKSLCDKDSKFKDALDEALMSVKNPWGYNNFFQKYKGEDARMRDMSERIYRAIKLDPLFKNPEFWDIDLSPRKVQKMIALTLKASKGTSTIDETIIDDIRSARMDAIKTMTNPPLEGAAKAIWSESILFVVRGKSLNPLHRWLTDPHNVKIVCTLNPFSEINDAVLDVPLPVITTKLDQVYASISKDRLRRLFCDPCHANNQKLSAFYIGDLAFRHKGNTNALGTAYVPDGENEAGSSDLVLVCQESRVRLCRKDTHDCRNSQHYLSHLWILFVTPLNITHSTHDTNHTGMTSVLPRKQACPL